MIWDAKNLHHKSMLLRALNDEKLTLWKLFKFLWQVIWNTEDEPCLATLRSHELNDPRQSSNMAHMTE